MKKVLISVILAVALAIPLTVPVAAAPPGPTIVDVAIAVNSEGPFAGQFDTLIAAVLAADPAVLKTLSGNGQFTVFAPTDDAFLALGLGACPSNSSGHV
ncbi:MAG: fasciclin domain-containing protein [Dehalococcoidia bacterium]